MGKRGKWIKDQKKKGLWVENPQDIVTCIFCQRSGDPNEFYVIVDPKGNIIKRIPEFSCYPELLSGRIDNMKVVCREDALIHREEIKREYPDHFRYHDRLPSVIETRKLEALFREKATPALFQAQNYMQLFNIWPDKSKVCSKCGRFHGQVYLEQGLPNVRFRVVVISFVERGFYDSPQQVMSHLICRDCEAENDVAVYGLDHTLKIIAGREEFVRQCRAAANRPQPRPSAPAKIVPIVKQDDRPTEVIIAERLARERQKKAAAR